MECCVYSGVRHTQHIRAETRQVAAMQQTATTTHISKQEETITSDDPKIQVVPRKSE